jgi:hypothetical protein
MQEMSDSQYQLLSKTAKWKTAQILKNAKSKMLCRWHSVQTVINLEEGKVTMECGCTRDLFSSDALASYSEEKAFRGKRIAGSNHKANILAVTQVEPA